MAGAIDARVEAVLQALRGHASAKVRDEMGPRYGVFTDKAMGVPMAKMQTVAGAARARPRPGRGALGNRLVRGAHGRLHDRRPG
jgi:hypothetical protein